MRGAMLRLQPPNVVGRHKGLDMRKPSSTHPSSPRKRHPACLAAIAALAMAGSQPAQALAFFDEITFYLTSGSYDPGDRVSTTFTFGAKPGVDLSAFEFQLSWDNTLVTSPASGPGSVAAWAEVLSAKGSVSLDFSGAQVIKGQWTADPLGGSGSLISTDYSNPVKAVFSFETSSALNVPFIVRIELTNIKNATGELMDTGSGFYNWATLSPVPEPSNWLALTCGLAAIAALRRPRWASDQTAATAEPLG